MPKIVGKAKSFMLKVPTMTKTILMILTLLLSFNLKAMSLQDLQSGDVLLLSLNCIECRMIESETDSPFSHSGIVLIDQFGRVRVAQALTTVHDIPFEKFISNITRGTAVHVYRPKQFAGWSQNEKELNAAVFYNLYYKKYRGLFFDSRFIWDNFDEKGNELLYCSEFIAKFLDNFLTEKTVPHIISYEKNWDYWYKLFRGDVPVGEVGNGPASFSRDQRFEFKGTIQ